MQNNEAKFLKSYDIGDYDRPSVAVDIAAFSIRSDEEENYKRDARRTLSLLLIRRGCPPFQGCWALPGGFLRMDETIEACAMREITEETHISPAALLPAGVFSRPDRDPRGRIISHAFVSVVSEDSLKAAGGSDAADARWFDFSFAYEEQRLTLTLRCDDIVIHAMLRETAVRFGVPTYEIIEDGGLPFDHAAIIANALHTLRRMSGSFELMFDFLPEKFTIASLQRVQEAILNLSLVPANFRRKAAAYIEETDEYLTGAGHRPAQLFRRKTTQKGGTSDEKNIDRD